jgi:hypothetical protein
VRAAGDDRFAAKGAAKAGTSQAMLFAWVLLVVGLVGAVFVSANARQLAVRPRRGTALRLSYRGYLLMAGGFLLIAVGGLLNILSV